MSASVHYQDGSPGPSECLEANATIDSLRAELAASESLVTALQEQMARDAERHAKAVAEAREEQREAMIHAYLTAPSTMGIKPSQASMVRWLRATPLDSTPLAARIAELEADRDDAVMRLGERLASTVDRRDFNELRAALSASESLVTALQEQMSRLAEQHAKAVAEAREEQREAMIFAYLTAPRTMGVKPSQASMVKWLRATPIDSTPLAARIAELEAMLSEIHALAGGDATQDAYDAVDYLLCEKNASHAREWGQSHAKDRAESALAAEVERHQATAKERDAMRLLLTAWLAWGEIRGPLKLAEDTCAALASLPAGPRVDR